VTIALAATLRISHIESSLEIETENGSLNRHGTFPDLESIEYTRSERENTPGLSSYPAINGSIVPTTTGTTTLPVRFSTRSLRTRSVANYQVELGT